MNLIEHTLLTLDFWQDNVTYEGSRVSAFWYSGEIAPARFPDLAKSVVFRR